MHASEPLAAVVFRTPFAALVGLAFVVPLAALVVRERAAVRARSNLLLQHPHAVRALPRVLAFVVLALLVAATAAQPATRDLSTTRVRSDAELYLTFDVSRSMLAASSPHGVVRFERARSIGRQIHVALRDIPTGVATLTNQMLPLLFPTGDERGVSAVLDRSLMIMQPPPAALTTARASQLGALTLAADRSYFNPGLRKRVLVVLSDLDSDFFSLDGTLKLLRRHGIEPFLIRVAAPGEQIFDKEGRAASYRSVSTVTVGSLRAAGWHAYEEGQTRQVIAGIRTYLGNGATHRSGIVETQYSLARVTALGALLLVLGLSLPSLYAGTRSRSRVSGTHRA